MIFVFPQRFNYLINLAIILLCDGEQDSIDSFNGIFLEKWYNLFLFQVLLKEKVL